MNWIRLLVTYIFISIIAVLGLEICTRIFSEVKFLGTSKTLFENKGHTANAKNNIAVTFNQKVFINKLGHRVSKKNFYGNDKSYKKRILFLGDSVAFGPGIKFENTFQGILENSYSDYQFINTSVIGHTVEDYERVIDESLSKNLIKKNDDVILFLCLNDISSISSKRIKELGDLKSLSNSESDYVIDLKQVKLINKLNVFLRQNSKLYLFIKGIITNPSKRYFIYETKLYKHLGKDGIKLALIPIKNIKEKLNMKGINLKVFILPYSYQLQNLDKTLLFPQKLISGFLEVNKIKYIDTIDYLLEKKNDSLSLFLKFDPMHFSDFGHLVLSQLLKKIIF